MRRSYLLHFPARPTTTSSSSFLAPFSTSSGTGDADQSQPDPPLTSSATARGGVKPPLPYSGRGRGAVSPQNPPSQPAFAPRSGADARGSPPTPPSSGRGFGGVSPAPPYAGRGRGGISPPLYQAAFSPRSEIESEGVSTPPLPSRKPMMFTEEAESRKPMKGPEEAKLPSGISSILSGAGRGTPIKGSPSVSKSVSVDDTKLKQENRHIRKQVRGETVRGESGRGEAVRGESGRGEAVRVDASPKGPKLSRADAVEKAKGILSKGDGGGIDQVLGRGGGGGRGTRGRGRGRGRGGRGRGRGDRFEDDEGDDVDYEGNEVQDKANEEILAKRLGPEMMNTLVEAFEDATDRVLPSPANDAYIDALHTNLMIECEPEYMMGEFDQNPDIDEKPPMALRDFLEKVKPFIMSYEGIQSQEEWEEAMKETMENVPLMKEIVDYYSGPDRVTAKRQQEELERVAKTLPASAPSSVKRFADRAVLSLQSNPGWGFDKKCQFMDKLVWEASQQYK